MSKLFRRNQSLQARRPWHWPVITSLQTITSSKISTIFHLQNIYQRSHSLTVMSLLSKSRLLKRFNFFNWSKVAECELSDGSDSHIFDNEKVMSRNHAVLHYREQRFFLEDTNSSNGTHVNDQRLQPYQVDPTIYWFLGSPGLIGCHLVPKISWGQLFY